MGVLRWPLAGALLLVTAAALIAAEWNHRRTQRRDDVREDQKTWNRTRTTPSDLVGMEGVRRRYTLRLTAPDDKHLGYFNADLHGNQRH